MKVNELQSGHYYVCYDTFIDEVDSSTVHIINYINTEQTEYKFCKTEYRFCKVYGEIITCSLGEFSRDYGFIKIYPSMTDFKEITDKQYAEILNKYKTLYSAIQKLTE